MRMGRVTAIVPVLIIFGVLVCLASEVTERNITLEVDGSVWVCEVNEEIFLSGDDIPLFKRWEFLVPPGEDFEVIKAAKTSQHGRVVELSKDNIQEEAVGGGWRRVYFIFPVLRDFDTLRVHVRRKGKVKGEAFWFDIPIQTAAPIRKEIVSILVRGMEGLKVHVTGKAGVLTRKKSEAQEITWRGENIPPAGRDGTPDYGGAYLSVSSFSSWEGVVNFLVAARDRCPMATDIATREVFFVPKELRWRSFFPDAIAVSPVLADFERDLGVWRTIPQEPVNIVVDDLSFPTPSAVLGILPQGRDIPWRFQGKRALLFDPKSGKLKGTTLRIESPLDSSIERNLEFDVGVTVATAIDEWIFRGDFAKAFIGATENDDKGLKRVFERLILYDYPSAEITGFQVVQINDEGAIVSVQFEIPGPMWSIPVPASQWIPLRGMAEANEYVPLYLGRPSTIKLSVKVKCEGNLRIRSVPEPTLAKGSWGTALFFAEMLDEKTAKAKAVFEWKVPEISPQAVPSFKDSIRILFKKREIPVGKAW